MGGKRKVREERIRKEGGESVGGEIDEEIILGKRLYKTSGCFVCLL